MRVALDAMGGDYAPEVNIEGALETISITSDIDIILVGQENTLKKELENRRFFSQRISIKPASQVVSMNESTGIAIRRKKDSSIRKGIELVKNGEADAFVSAGHSGVVMGTALLLLGTAKVVDRPAIATIMPTMNKPFVLIDAGANIHCKPYNLLQFALMGSTYCKTILARSNPKVALVSTGEEDIKGNELTKETFKLLKEADINFVGNIDGKDIFTGNYDVSFPLTIISVPSFSIPICASTGAELFPNGTSSSICNSNPSLGISEIIIFIFKEHGQKY